MADLYKGIAGSPITYLTSDITANQTTISIADDSALPDAPNICTIGYGEHLETIKYETKSNGVLQNVTRGIEGTPRAWQAGTEVARFFTAYDHNAIIDDFIAHKAENTTQGNPHGIDAKANKVQEAWLTPTLLNGWENLATNFAQVGYYKDEFGVVHIKGFVRSGTENVIFILPSGYRSSETIYFPVIADDTTPSFVQIIPNGQVSKPTGLTVTKWLNLTGIAFRVDV